MASRIRKMVMISEIEYKQLLQNSKNGKDSSPHSSAATNTEDYANERRFTDEIAQRIQRQSKKEENIENDTEMNKSTLEKESDSETTFENVGEFESSIQQRGTAGLDVILERITEYIVPKDHNKAITLAKRIFHTKNSGIHIINETVLLGKFTFSFQEFIDLIEICLSRRKPRANAVYTNFVKYLAINNIPQSLITNKYLKNAMLENEESPTSSRRLTSSPSRSRSPHSRSPFPPTTEAAAEAPTETAVAAAVPPVAPSATNFFTNWFTNANQIPDDDDNNKNGH